MYFKIKYNLIRAILFLLILPKRGFVAEVGVWKGVSAKMLYYLTLPQQLRLVDPYQADLCDEVYQKRLPDYELNYMYLRVKKWSENKRITFHKMTSKEASDLVDETRHLLHYVYLDGDHFDVYNDLNNWIRNVRKGGIIMGDDYGNKGYPKVKQDVDRFCKERGIKLKHFHYQFWFKV